MITADTKVADDSQTGIAASQRLGPVPFLAVMMFFVAAAGSRSDSLVQDTLKSAIIALLSLLALLVFFWQQRDRQQPLRWHGVLFLPLVLMGFALASMAWSHTYLGAVEAIRWFIFSVLLWLGLNSFSRQSLPALAWGIHGGVVVASLWAALQFWFDFMFFSHVSPPASTFVNRNFFAEYAVTALPFSALLLLRSRSNLQIAAMAASAGLVVLALMMTGTRSASITMVLLLLIMLPLAARASGPALSFRQWTGLQRVMAGGIFLGMVLGLGMIRTGNATLIDEAPERGRTALERFIKRASSVSVSDGSLSTRFMMWSTSMGMIERHPLAGVGAGAWEEVFPLYQTDDTLGEADFLAHNEYVQLVSEYGLVGWIFLLGLIAYVTRSTGLILVRRNEPSNGDDYWPAFALCSLFALLLVSALGFPWHLAGTGALMALALGILAAADSRAARSAWLHGWPIPWSPLSSRIALATVGGCLVLAVYITRQAMASEDYLIKALGLARAITATGDHQNPALAAPKAEALALVSMGIRLNPHYRRVTPLVADEFGRWDDWKNATWIWESIVASRPYIVPVLTNIGRGYVIQNEPAKAAEYLERARQVRPNSGLVRALDVLVTNSAGNREAALAKARAAIRDGVVDYDLFNTTFALASRAGDYHLALQAMELRLRNWPSEEPGIAYVQIGKVHDSGLKNPDKALEAFRKALSVSTAQQRVDTLRQIPAAYLPQLGYGAAPVTPPSRTASTPAR